MLDIVKARNVGDTDYIAKHDRYGEITIAAGTERVIPLAVALVCFGNPGATNSGKNRLRDIELRHVKLYHGFADGLQPDSDWETLRPQIEIHDIEDDHRIWMVHDDPTGEYAAAGLQETVAQAMDPNVIIARHQAEQEARYAEAIDTEPRNLTKKELTQAERNQHRDDIPTADADEPEPHEDRPRTTRVGTAKKSTAK